jgi:hypothetical protein
VDFVGHMHHGVEASQVLLFSTARTCEYWKGHIVEHQHCDGYGEATRIRHPHAGDEMLTKVRLVDRYPI